MSVNQSIDMKCPKCGENQSFNVWQLINIKENPELKEKVLNQEIFNFTCCKCNESMIILYPFIYHDDDKKFFIYFNPDGDFSNVINQEGYITKTAEDYLEFLEIIKILEDNIDFEKVKSAKEGLLKQFKDNEKLKEIKRVFYLGMENGKIAFFVPEIKGKVLVNL